MPTTRDLAAALRVTKNTVSKAYAELRRAGVAAGSTSGLFIADNAVANARVIVAREILSGAVRNLKSLSLSRREVTACCRETISLYYDQTSEWVCPCEPVET